MQGRSASPAVVRTLLLTDLVDSTRFVERVGDRRAAEIGDDDMPFAERSPSGGSRSRPELNERRSTTLEVRAAAFEGVDSLLERLGSSNQCAQGSVDAQLQLVQLPVRALQSPLVGVVVGSNPLCELLDIRVCVLEKHMNVAESALHPSALRNDLLPDLGRLRCHPLAQVAVLYAEAPIEVADQFRIHDFLP